MTKSTDMEGNTYDLQAEHRAATDRLNELVSEYLATKKAEREVKKSRKNSWTFSKTFKFLGCNC